MNIIQDPAAESNYRDGRAGHEIVGIIIHVEAGSEAGTDAWFADPVSHVSAHYSVSKTGQIYQHLAEEDEAFHAGIVVEPTWQWCLDNPGINPNLCTIGIEHEGLATDIWPDEQYSASAELIADICKRRSIPINDQFIVPHRAIRANKSCPGNGDVPRLIATAIFLTL